MDYPATAGCNLNNPHTHEYLRRDGFHVICILLANKTATTLDGLSVVAGNIVKVEIIHSSPRPPLPSPSRQVLYEYGKDRVRCGSFVRGRRRPRRRRRRWGGGKEIWFIACPFIWKDMCT